MARWEVYQDHWGCRDLTRADLASFADSKWVFDGCLLHFRCFREDQEIWAAICEEDSFTVRQFCNLRWMVMPKTPTSVHDTSLTLWRSCALMAISREGIILPQEMLRTILLLCMCND